MSNKLIDFMNISKAYGMQTVLDDFNLYIEKMNPDTSGTSGCGKQPHFVFWEALKRRMPAV